MFFKKELLVWEIRNYNVWILVSHIKTDYSFKNLIWYLQTHNFFSPHTIESYQAPSNIPEENNS